MVTSNPVQIICLICNAINRAAKEKQVTPLSAENVKKYFLDRQFLLVMIIFSVLSKKQISKIEIWK